MHSPRWERKQREFVFCEMEIVSNSGRRRGQCDVDHTSRGCTPTPAVTSIWQPSLPTSGRCATWSCRSRCASTRATGDLIAQIGEQRRIAGHATTRSRRSSSMRFSRRRIDRFFQHTASSYLGIARAAHGRPDRGQQDPGRQHDHHAGRAQHVPDARQDLSPQAAGNLRHLSRWITSSPRRRSSSSI